MSKTHIKRGPGKSGSRRRKKNVDISTGADDDIDSFGAFHSKPQTVPLNNHNKRYYNQSGNGGSSSSKNMHSKQIKMSNKSKSLPVTAEHDVLYKHLSNANQQSQKGSNTTKPNNNKKKRNLVIKINDTNNAKNNKNSAKNKQHARNELMGDVLMHFSSFNELHNNPKDKGQQNNKHEPWKTVYGILENEALRFWTIKDRGSSNNTNKHTYAMHAMDKEHSNNRNYEEDPDIIIYLSEMLGISKPIKSIDGQKCVVEISTCGQTNKCMIAFGNMEQREYWHSLLSDFHLNYCVWRSSPLDAQKRRSQHCIAGVHKLLNHQRDTKYSFEEARGILYIEEMLQKISKLNINKIVDIVPLESKFMAGRLVRVIISIRFFFMSVLKSLSGADIPLPARQDMMDYLEEIECMDFTNCNAQMLDYLTDKCYRILFNLSFAFTSNCRDEIMKLNEYLNEKNKRNSHNNNSKERELKLMADMKFEYESLQRSWKMHRDRLQEYVMAYRDAIAKLKHSYHQRDKLCKKVEGLQKEKVDLKNEFAMHSEQYTHAMGQAKKLSNQFAILSSSMAYMDQNNNGINMNGNMPNTVTHLNSSMSQGGIANSSGNMNANNSMNSMSPKRGYIPKRQRVVSQNKGMSAENRLSPRPVMHGIGSGNTLPMLNLSGNDGNMAPASPSLSSNEDAQRLKQCTLDLITLKAEKEKILLLEPTNPSLQIVLNKILEIEDEMASINNNQFNFKPPMQAPPPSPPLIIYNNMNNHNHNANMIHSSQSLQAMHHNSNKNGNNNNNNMSNNQSHAHAQHAQHSYHGMQHTHTRQMSEQIQLIGHEMSQLIQSMETQKGGHGGVGGGGGQHGNTNNNIYHTNMNNNNKPQQTSQYSWY